MQNSPIGIVSALLWKYCILTLAYDFFYYLPLAFENMCEFHAESPSTICHFEHLIKDGLNMNMFRSLFLHLCKTAINKKKILQKGRKMIGRL